MNSGVSAQIEQAYFGLWYGMLVALALYFLKVILAIVLRWRVGTALTPGLAGDQAQTFFPRVLAMFGMHARTSETLGTTRLRATIGLRLLCWGAVPLLIYFHRQMNAATIGPETLITALVVLNALQIELYEITHDRADVTLPRWWFGRTIHRWHDLVALTDRDPWMMTMHFADGRRVKVHKYIVDHADFMTVAKAAIRNI